MGTQTVQYDQLPEDLKALSNAIADAKAVVEGADNRVSGLNYQGSSANALRGAQSDFTSESNTAMNTTDENNADNINMISESYQNAEADVNSDVNKSAGMDGAHI
jgi:hypothetical protein